MHDVTEFWARSIRDARLPYCARKLAAAQDRANQEQLLAQYQDPVLDIFCPVYAQAGFTDTAGCEVLDRLLMTMFALRAYHEEHHGYPETLAALVPEYLAAVPADPFVAMQPLHYRRTEGGYRLYSVGPDGRDDGGRPITNLSHLEPAWSPEKRRQARYTIGPDSQGDIVAGFNTHAGTPN